MTCWQGHNPGKTHDTANTVLLTELVQEAEKLDSVGDGLLGSDDLDGNTLVEVNGNIEGLVRGIEGRDSLGPHILGRGHVGVLEHASLQVVSNVMISV